VNEASILCTRHSIHVSFIEPLYAELSQCLHKQTIIASFGEKMKKKEIVVN